VTICGLHASRLRGLSGARLAGALFGYLKARAVILPESNVPSKPKRSQIHPCLGPVRCRDVSCPYLFHCIRSRRRGNASLRKQSSQQSAKLGSCQAAVLRSLKEGGDDSCHKHPQSFKAATLKCNQTSSTYCDNPDVQKPLGIATTTFQIFIAFRHSPS